MPNEIKQLRYGSIAAPIAPMAGSFTLTFDSQTTDPIDWDAVAADIDATLEALSSIGSGNVEVTDDGGGGFYIEFVGTLANMDVGALSADSNLKQAAATVTVTENQEGDEPTPTSPSIDDDFTDGDESNPATMSFSFSPSPTSGTWSVDGNTFAWDQTPTATGWSFNGPASNNPTATTDSNGSTSPLSYSDIDLNADVGGQQQIDTVTLTDSPTEGQFFLNEDAAGEFGPFNYNADASTIDSAIDAETAYGVSGGSGGPWTMTSDGKAPFIWTGYEDAGSPLRKALGIEVETDQEGGSIEGSGDISFDVSAPAGMCQIGSTGTGSIAFAVSGLDADGTAPNNAGAGAVAFAGSALAGVGSMPYAGTGSVTAAAALAGTGTISSAGTGDETAPVAALAGSGSMFFAGTGSVRFLVELTGVCQLSDTSLPYKHFEEFSTVERFLRLA